MQYVLDTSAILQSPEVLARARTHKLLIPSAVVDDLLNRARPEPRSLLSSLLSNALGAGAEVVQGPRDAPNLVSPADRTHYSLDPTDMLIVATAVTLREESGDSVSVITLDKRLGAFLERNGIAWISPKDFLALDIPKKADSTTLASAASVTRAQSRYLVVSALAGALAALLGRAGYDNIGTIVGTAPIWGTLLVVFLLGVGLYWYRERYRLAYGITEFFIGFMMSGYVFYPAFEYSSLQLVHAIQLLGGLYVMVRGLDNMGQGLESTRWEALWKRVFS